jgi:UDP:flavonoid glycosyltransferase YjiC (YdhE family)
MGHRAALPQIILAQWYDLYDNANRAEYRGIGVYGNRSSAPDIDAEEFAAALSRTVGPGPEAEGYRSRALEISGLCRAAGGRKAAVDRILELTIQ